MLSLSALAELARANRGDLDLSVGPLLIGDRVFDDPAATLRGVTFALMQYERSDPDFRPFDSKYDYFLRGTESLHLNTQESTTEALKTHAAAYPGVIVTSSEKALGVGDLRAAIAGIVAERS